MTCALTRTALGTSYCGAATGPWFGPSFGSGRAICGRRIYQPAGPASDLPSMSRPANPYDNAACESFMRTLKREEINAGAYQDLEVSAQHLESFIERYYNQVRLHSALGYQPPAEFEAALPAAGVTAAATMSFFRHGEDYQTDATALSTGSAPQPTPQLIGCDESPAGYSLARCSPAERASASPATGDSETKVLV